MEDYLPMRFWSKYSKAHPMAWNKPENYIEMDMLIRWIRQYSIEGNILDVGSGWGRLCKRLRERDIRNKIAMCDISPEYIREAKALTDILPTWWDGKTLPYEENSFNLIVAQSLLLHVNSRSIRKVFSELIRVSREYIYIATSNPKRTKERIKKNQDSRAYVFTHDYTHLIKDFQLEIVEVKCPNELRIAWLLRKPNENTRSKLSTREKV